MQILKSEFDDSDVSTVCWHVTSQQLCNLLSSFMCRIELIGPLEVQGKFGTLQRKQITLVDDDGAKLQFLLWGDQVVLANLLR